MCVEYFYPFLHIDSLQWVTPSVVRTNWLSVSISWYIVLQKSPILFAINILILFRFSIYTSRRMTHHLNIVFYVVFHVCDEPMWYFHLSYMCVFVCFILSTSNREVFHIEASTHRVCMDTVKKSVLDGTHNWQANLSITGKQIKYPISTLNFSMYLNNFSEKIHKLIENMVNSINLSWIYNIYWKEWIFYIIFNEIVIKYRV